MIHACSAHVWLCGWKSGQWYYQLESSLAFYSSFLRCASLLNAAVWKRIKGQLEKKFAQPGLWKAENRYIEFRNFCHNHKTPLLVITRTVNLLCRERCPKLRPVPHKIPVNGTLGNTVVKNIASAGTNILSYKWSPDEGLIERIINFCLFWRLWPEAPDSFR